MTSIFKRGAEFLSEKRHADASVSITYKRGSDSVTISATPGRADDDLSEVSGYTLDADRVDWIIRRADLVLDGSATDPQEGDIVELVNGSKTQTYEVRRDQLGEVFRFCDEFRTDLRFHTIAGAES